MEIDFFFNKSNKYWKKYKKKKRIKVKRRLNIWRRFSRKHNISALAHVLIRFYLINNNSWYAAKISNLNYINKEKIINNVEITPINLNYLLVNSVVDEIDKWT